MQDVIPYDEEKSDKTKKELLKTIEITIEQLDVHKNYIINKDNRYEYKRIITIHRTDNTGIYFSVEYKSPCYTPHYYYIMTIDKSTSNFGIYKAEVNYEYIYTKLDVIVKTF